MAKGISEGDLDLLGELGVDTREKKKPAQTAREQRIIAGFEDIENFLEEQGRLPEHGAGNDIFERLYATRLDQIRKSSECMVLLKKVYKYGILDDSEDGVWEVNEESPQEDDALLEALGVCKDTSKEITELKYVKPKQEPDEVAQRKKCEDFAKFKPLFQKVQQELDSGIRATRKYQDNAEILRGALFIVEGQKAYVAEMGELFVSNHGRKDCRLRVIYDNGTESDLLLRSMQRALNRDDTSRRISDPDLGPLFANAETEEDTQTGYIYVLRSLSDHSFISENRLIIHKIGVTTGSVERRVANATKDPTFLLADVEIVETYKLSNLNPGKLEKLLQRFFSSVRLDLRMEDRFFQEVEAHEWFLVPLQAIDDAVQRVLDGTIAGYRYEPTVSRVVKISSD